MTEEKKKKLKMFVMVFVGLVVLAGILASVGG